MKPHTTPCPDDASRAFTIHDDIGLNNTSRFEQFLSQYPAYKRTEKIDALRKTEFTRLDKDKHVYLDFGGAGLHAESQVRRHLTMLNETLQGNPHSRNRPSKTSTELVDATRAHVLKFFNANPNEYVVIFTPNASGALKLVGESYPFTAGSRCLLCTDNHNSVNGIREFAKAKGAEVSYAPLVSDEIRMDENATLAELQQPAVGKPSLFAFPAQSNFTGVQHPLSWASKAKQYGWDVLIDAASFVPTSKLDIDAVQPDFVPISFYKMFGYPTGLGALIVKKTALAKLQRPWFAGGTLSAISVQVQKHHLTDGAARFEDGTVNFLDIPALKFGLDLIESVGYDVIKDRVMSLSGWLIRELLALKHSTGVSLVRIYGPANVNLRGGTVAMNFFDLQGNRISHESIEAETIQHNISIRTGMFCNPGSFETVFEVPHDKMQDCFQKLDSENSGSVKAAFRACMELHLNGAERISLGYISNFDDVEAFLAFAREMIH